MEAKLIVDERKDITYEEECFNQEFADRVTKLCHSKYASLPKTGKPKKDLEWTMLSAVVLVRRGSTSDMEVVALATGSKCIGINKMSPKGDILNDSHAEVLARRGFLRYLYHQIQLAKKGSSSEVLAENKDGKYIVHNDVTFHLYCSHTPCGDASIFPKTIPADENDFGACISIDRKKLPGDIDTEMTAKNPQLVGSKGSDIHLVDHKRSADYIDTETIAKRLKLAGGGDSDDTHLMSSGEIDSDTNAKRAILGGSGGTHLGYRIGTSSDSDIHRTGAKCIPEDTKRDEHLPGSGYHVVGAVRTKPGRGDPTLSVSCSDKLMRWNCVGLQGALLSLLLAKPVYLKSIIIGGRCPYSADAMKRALIDRVLPARSHIPTAYGINRPVFLQASIPFPDGRYASKATQPSPTSIIWCCLPNRNLEVAVEGKKQGATKKSHNTHASRLLISKFELLHQFQSIIESSDATSGAKNYHRTFVAKDTEAHNTIPSCETHIGSEDACSVLCRGTSDTDCNEKHGSYSERDAKSGDNAGYSNSSAANDCDKKFDAKYSDFKSRAFEYQSTWRAIRSAAKLCWTVKNPILLDFLVDDATKHQLTRRRCSRSQ